MQYIIDTDQKLTEVLNSGHILVLDQPAKKWLIYDDKDKNYNEKVIEVNVEQFEMLERLATNNSIYKNSFMVTNTSMLLSYMCWGVANKTLKSREAESVEFELRM